MMRTPKDRLEAMTLQKDRPPVGCRRHGKHDQRCRECIDSFIDGVAWHLVHPYEKGNPEVTPLAFDPTPCGICGSVIGEGLMTLHMGVCPGRP